MWHAWRLRSAELVLKHRDIRALDLSIPQSSILFVTSEAVEAKNASDYLRNEIWIEAFETRLTMS